MLERKELERFGPPGFNLGQKEKDYVQHWVLSYISRSGFGGSFKGGTCLQKVFGLPRYSEDLDFTLNNAVEPDGDSLSAFLSGGGFSGISWKILEKTVSSTVKVRLRGPLYNGTAPSECTIRMEFSRREKTILKPKTSTINPPYPDLLPYQLKVLDEREIAAEKVRAILSRASARDLFDLYFLLRRGVRLEHGLIEAKLEFYKLIFDKKAIEMQIKKLAKIWKTEMAAFTPNMLDYRMVAKEVLAAVGK